MLNIRYREKTSAWPGFVDLFSNLVIILIFLLIVFVFLWTTTSVFNKDTGIKTIADLEKTKQEQAEQIVQMTADKEEAEKLLIAARDALETQEQQIVNQQNDLASAYETKLSELQSTQEELAQQIAELTQQLHQANNDKTEMARMEAERHAMQDELSMEKSQLNDKIAELEQTLKEAEERAKQKDVEYVELSNRLNKALADKVAELNSLSEYQSEFYKQIKQALNGRTTVQQDGDRFIISSDILFSSGSYTISQEGKNQLRLLANVIKDFEITIPSDINWIIRVDGHTDKKDVVRGTRAYRNNMQLSLLRATAVIDELTRDGVSKRRLIPSGFGDMHPVELGDTPEALQKNRRIELQLTNK